MAVKSYRDLDVWKLSKSFARDVYLLTEQFPKDERFSLTQQVRRSVDLGYAAGDAVDELLLKSDRISKMLYALHESLSSTEYRVPSTEYA